MSPKRETRYTRVYSDSSGESHFAEVEVEFRSTNFAPPAPPLELSEFMPVERLAFMLMRAGWRGDWHPAPRKQFLIVLSGKIECFVTKEGSKSFAQGGVLLLEDTVGKGHMIHSIEGDTLIAVVQLSNEGRVNVHDR